MSFEISKSVYFEAAHALPRTAERPHYERLHGHSFQVKVVLSGLKDEERGWVEDLGMLKTRLDDIAGQLDHTLLNEIDGLERPTLENLCEWFGAKIAPLYPGKLKRVTVSRPSLGEHCSWTPVCNL